MKKELLTGNQALVRGAYASGAFAMTGYPITPTTEVLEEWINLTLEKPQLKYLQTEDEMSAGFSMIGAILAGKKAFSATAGPGNVLMQDPLSMAENMRLPIVLFINQRGGPSTGTVIYSQQELNLSCFGGNGEGLRIVYSCSSVQDMYDYALKSFNIAWKYRFPTIVLSDGYLAKTLTEIETYDPQEKQVEIIAESAYLLNPNKEIGRYINLRNTYNLETELSEKLNKYSKDYAAIVSEIVEFEDYKTLDAEIVIFAHGIVSSAARDAIDKLRSEDIKVGLFRPITLRPFPKETAKAIVKNKKIILVAESSLGQFENMVKNNLYGENIPIKTLLKPAEGITSQEIINRIKELNKELK